mmetsp:Transcript_722/g.1149  ORF Transcript_722/g.1149 Transcript_722/m.1149 type:complete len:126 (-) Transcript_722:33-410(-)
MNRLAKYGAQALRPSLIDGKWVKPLISARRAADLRKQAIIQGTFGKFEAETGKGWLSEWDSVKKIPGIRPPKLHQHQRNREQRFEKIEKAMKDMPNKVEKYRRSVADSKPAQGIETTFKRLSQQR